jgi:hypothetical protein
MDNTNIINNINVNNSMSSINNQSEFINYKSSSMNKESNSDFLFYALQNNNKRDDSEAPQKKKNIIRIKKNKLSNSIKLENGEKNSLINQNQSIYVNKSKKKSNGKKFNIVNSTNINDYNKTITISKKNSDLLIKNLKYKCLNGKAKNIDIKNENIIILSKHKKNYDNDANINFNYADKLTTCSIPQINNTINNNNVITNSDYKNTNQILSELALPKKKKSTKISSKKLSFTGNNSNNKKSANYKKKNNINNNINCKISNKNKLSNRKNNVNCKSKINIYDNMDDGEGKSERNKEEDNICDSLTVRCSQKTFRNIKNNNSVVASSKKNERKKSIHGYKKKLFF